MSSIEVRQSDEFARPLVRPGHLHLVEDVVPETRNEPRPEPEKDVSLSGEKIFYRDLDQTHQLPEEEITRLAQLALAGDVKARNAIVEANLRLPLKQANKEVIRQNRMDAFQWAAIRLIRGAELYDPSTGYALSTYVDNWTREGVARARRENDHRSLLKEKDRLAYGRASKSIHKLRNKLGREPELHEIVADTGEGTVEWLADLLQQALPAVSLNEPTQGPEGVGELELIDTLYRDEDTHEAEDTVHESMKSEALSAMLAKLSDQHRNVIEQHFGLNGESGQTLIALRKQLSLSEPAMRLLRNEALAVLQQAAEELGINFETFSDD